MIRVDVKLGDRSYPVLVGPGASHRLEEVLPERAHKAAVVTQEAVGAEVEPGRECRRFVIGEGEGAKSLETVGELCRGFARWGLTRGDAVVAVGGGVVTDTAGFAAASYHRGIALVNVATTLVAQVDAAIGGKTGVNIPEGKNLIGAFWQPVGVLCDTEVLKHLPPREFTSGLGEVAKYSFLGEPGVEALPLDERVARCVQLKANIVEADERESGLRALLNYGHTLAHALETVAASTGSSLDIRHGEAVARGLVFAARLARRMGRVDNGVVDHHLEVVSGYGLPYEMPVGLASSELISIMYRDKKAVNGLTMVLDGPTGLEVVPNIDQELVRATLDESGCR